METTTWLGQEMVEGDSRQASLDLEDLELDLDLVALAAEGLGEVEVSEEGEMLQEETLEEVLEAAAWVDWEEVQDMVGPVMED